MKIQLEKQGELRIIFVNCLSIIKQTGATNISIEYQFYAILVLGEVVSHGKVFLPSYFILFD